MTGRPRTPTGGRATRPSPREATRILEERARALARPPVLAAAPGAILDVVTFTLDGERRALDLRFVRAVGRTPELTPLPAAPKRLLGVACFRGEVVAVFDLAAGGAGRVRPHLLFLGRGAIEMAIVADAVDEVVRLPASAVVMRPWRADDAGDKDRRGITAEGLSIIDAETLLADEQFMAGALEAKPVGWGADR